MNRDFKGIWIPKEIWFSTYLSIKEKCLLAEINSRYDGNIDEIDMESLRQFLGCTRRYLRKMIRKLINLNLIKIIDKEVLWQ